MAPWIGWLRKDDFNDVEKKSLGGLLRSLAFQLYRRGGEATSSHLDQLFTSCGGGSKDPDDLELESCVSAMVKATGQVFILIDPLDECTSRKSFLSWIGRAKSESIQFILTTRPEDYIQKSLSRFLGEENCLSLDKTSTRFRWAACQIDSIAEFEIVATRMDHHQSRFRFDIEDRLFNPLSIERYCPGLISAIKIKDKGHKEIHISHFSVQEYLLQNEEFGQEKSAVVISHTLLAYLADIGGPFYRMSLDFPLAKYAAFDWAWFALAAGPEESTVRIGVEFLSNPNMLNRWHRIWHEEFRDLTAQKSPAGYETAFGTSVDRFGAWEPMPDSPTASGLEYACLQGLTEAVRRLIKDSNPKFQRMKIETYSFTAMGPRPEHLFCEPLTRAFREMFELLLKVGADIDDQGWWSNILATAMHHAFVEGRAATVRQLIQAGADI
ncbi:hypothetical protein DER46DRAFT_672692 [Fusarium sp. MPI-SDFR-AT-0072]|nr:hypothetical protein DER46DRAFT_672692 [Fusarium sp. MPI-SDFR-AT-0072]